MRSVGAGRPEERAVAVVLTLAALTVGLVLLGPSPGAAPSSAAPEPDVSARSPEESCDRWLPVSRAGATSRVQYCANRDLAQGDPSVRSAVIVVHGDARNVSDYFGYALEAARLAGHGDDLVVAPRFATSSDIRREAQPDDVVTWSSEAWKDGGDSTTTDANPTSVSSFEVVDQLIGLISDSERFPNLSSVVLIGHSAGGQFVNRYAAGSLSAASTRPEVALTYVVANPSSYLYFDDRRVLGRDGNVDRPSSRDRSDCRSYDRYKYGLNDLNSYMVARGARAITDQYATRRVVYALGELDTDERADSMDTSCAGRLQGRNRLERGLNYYHYLGTYYGPAVRQFQTLVSVPGVTHDGRAMLTSDALRPILFGTAQP